MALTIVEADSCPGCGHPWAECSDLQNEDNYVAELQLCHACRAGAKRVTAHTERNGTTDGLHVLITKRG